MSTKDGRHWAALASTLRGIERILSQQNILRGNFYFCYPKFWQLYTSSTNSNIIVFIYIITTTTIIFIIISLFPSLRTDSAANGAMQNLESVKFKCVQKLNVLAVVVNERIEIPFRLTHTHNRPTTTKERCISFSPLKRSANHRHMQDKH